MDWNGPPTDQPRIMNRIIIKQQYGEDILVDTDSIIAIEHNHLVEVYDLNGMACGIGCTIHLAGGSTLEVRKDFSDLIAALFGCDLVDDDDSYHELDPDLNNEGEA